LALLEEEDWEEREEVLKEEDWEERLELVGGQ